MKILCVEDDHGLAILLQQALSKQHYQLELVTDGLMGWNLAETETYDLILLDWMLPNLTGIDFCRKLRSQENTTLNPNRETPVLLMTAMNAVTHKVVGLDAGADDYVVKPFALDELLARIRALMRRGQRGRSPLLYWGDICFNPNRCEVTYQDRALILGTKEYELLELFLRNPDQIFSLNRLLTALWKVDEMPSEGAVRAHIKGLRQKLKRAGVEDPIDTIYKLGYRLKPPPAKGTAQLGDRPTPPPGELQEPEPSVKSGSVLPEFEEIWEAVRPSYCDRFEIIQQALTALQNQTLTPLQQQAAEREAHTLIGSLGSFGLDDASKICRQIQTRLKQSTALGPADLDELRQWMAALSPYLGTSTAMPVAEIPVAEISIAEMPTADKPTTRTMEAIAPLKLASRPDRSASTAAVHAPLLLIVDSQKMWAHTIGKEAESWGWQVEIATTFTAAQQPLQSGSINAMVVNLDGDNAYEQNLEFLAAVRSQHPTLLVTTITSFGSLEQRLQTARLGIRYFFKAPIAPAQLLATITPIHQYPQPSTAKILVVDHDMESLQRLNTILTSQRYGVTLLSQPERFWQTLE
ncbi:MAG TPA: response regulator, partial [Chroococcidiopsis sp.]